MKHIWTYLWILLFVVIVLQHTSGIWYDTATMEASTEWVRPVAIYFPQILILFLIQYFLYKKNG